MLACLGDAFDPVQVTVVLRTGKHTLSQIAEGILGCKYVMPLLWEKKAPLACGNRGPLSQDSHWKKTASVFEYFMLVTGGVKFYLSSLYAVLHFLC